MISKKYVAAESDISDDEIRSRIGKQAGKRIYWSDGVAPTEDVLVLISSGTGYC